MPFLPETSSLGIGTDFAPLPEYKSAGTTSIDFDGLLPTPLTLREDLKSGCGGQTWPAGMVLAKHMLRYHSDRLQDARIIELGAGGGLVGLAVAKACAVESPVLITDQVEMYDLMQHNILLNSLGGKAEALILNWGESLPPMVRDFRPNIILAADCVYFEPSFPLLLETLTDLLALNPDATVYFCFKKRRRADMSFLKMAKKAFEVLEVEDEGRPAYAREGLFLLTFTSRPAADANNGIAAQHRADRRGKGRTTRESPTFLSVPLL